MSGRLAGQTGPAARGRHHQIDRRSSTTRTATSAATCSRRRSSKEPASEARPKSQNELQVQATIEPDADNDGFGDETQDQCPTQATTQGACDTAPPGVNGLKVVNGKVSYSLTEAATVSLRVEKKSKGRKVGKKCVKQTQGNRAKKACSRFTPVGGAFSGAGTVGSHQVAIPRKLKPGSYRLTLTATDAAGNVTTQVMAFRIAAPKKGKRAK